MEKCTKRRIHAVKRSLCAWTRVLSLGILFTYCEFSSSFEHIEENRVRTIDFVYRNRADTTLCEAAPGDSMEITALFAGEKVEDIALSVSFDVQVSIYGMYTAFDSLPLDYTVIRSTLHSSADDADTFVFRFEIPDDILVTSSYLPEDDWAGQLPAEIRGMLPPALAAMKKSEIVGLLDGLSEQSVPPDSIAGFSFTEFFPFAETIMQIFTAPVELRALVNGQYEIVSYCMVRYNRRLSHLDESIPCNRNPFVTRMGIYRVYQNSLQTFDPSRNTQRHDTIVLYDREREINNREYTLHIKTGVSYFLFAQSDAPQETRSLTGFPVRETHYYEWFYQQDFTGADSVPSSERMALLTSADGPVIRLLPAATRSIDHCGIWVQVRDEAPGVRLYPTGSSVFHTNIFFTYSDEYIKKQEVL